MPGEVQTETRSPDAAKSRRKKLLILFVAQLILVSGVGFFLYQRGYFHREDVPVAVSTPLSETTEPIQAAAPEEIQEPIPEVSELPPTGRYYRSENFQAGEIAIGGDAAILVDLETAAPLVISGVRGEAFTEKGRNRVKLVIGWHTNKLALSEVSYGKGIGVGDKNIAEETYGTTHGVTISGLEQASTYVYRIKSRDRWGNEVTSEPYAVYTGARNVSLFDLISDAVGEVFGWAVKEK